MAVVTDTPILIDQDNDAISPVGQPGSFFGRFDYASPDRLYQLMIGVGTIDGHMPVFKSLDAGLSWTRMDGANEPTSTVERFNAFPDTTKIYTRFSKLGSPGNSAPVVKSFNVLTDQWGADGATGPDILTRNTQQYWNDDRIIAVAGDVWYFYWDRQTRGHIKYIVFSSGGTWGSAFDIANTPGTNYELRQVVFDGVTTFHVIYVDSGSNPLAVKHRTVTTAGVISSEQAAFTITGADNNSAAGARFGQAYIWNSKIYLPGLETITNKRSGAWVGDISGGPTPVWSWEQINTLSQSSSIRDDDQLVFVGSDNTIRSIWAYQDFTSIFQIYYSDNSGSGWSTPVLYYDAIDNPPPNPPLPADQFIHDMSMGEQADGTIGVVTGLETDISCVGFYLFAGEAPPPPVPPTLICNSPPGGFVTQAYSHQLGLTGGTPPYTVTITVGALPTGLSISNTGLITGTPTLAGTFTFTVHVVDSASAVANVQCSITIINLPGNNCPDADNGGPG